MTDKTIDRRSILRRTAWAIAGLAITTKRVGGVVLRAAGATGHLIAPPWAPPSGRTWEGLEEDSGQRIARVKVEPDRIIRIVTGLRPFRPSGFVVRGERLGGKTVVHNYGHGGCGVTLSWGTANLAVAEGLKTIHRRAAVLGCGAVGLATARLLQDHGFQVTIYAKALSPDTTSNIAGALWGPVTLSDHDHRTPAFATQFGEACRFAHRYFQLLVGQRYGVGWVPIYYLGDSAPDHQSWEASIVPELYTIAPVPREANPFPAAYVFRRDAMMIEPNTYLPAVMSDFCVRGGKIVVRDFPNLPSVLRLTEPLIFNCTGLGAKQLFHDKELDPIKGQLTVLEPQPEVDYGLISRTDDLYMFPRNDGIVLGGSHEDGEWSLEPSKTEAERIFQGHKKLFAEMH